MPQFMDQGPPQVKAGACPAAVFLERNDRRQKLQPDEPPDEIDGFLGHSFHEI